MIVDRLEIGADEFESGTGWALKPEGACKGEVCVPLRGGERDGDRVSLEAIASTLGMPLVEASGHGIWALGPESLGGHALTTAEAPDLELEDLAGETFRLSSLRGQKILLYAWAPY